MAVYNRGDIVGCAEQFEDGGGNPKDPSDVIFVIMVGVIPVATYVYGIDPQVRKTVDQDGVPIPGAFSVSWDTSNFSGAHIYAFIGIGVVRQTVIGSFSVSP